MESEEARNKSPRQQVARLEIANVLVVAIAVGRRFIQNLLSRVGVCAPHQESNASHKRRDKEANHVVVGKVTFDSGRIKTALGEESLVQISKSANRHQILKLDLGFDEIGVLI